MKWLLAAVGIILYEILKIGIGYDTVNDGLSNLRVLELCAKKDLYSMSYV